MTTTAPATAPAQNTEQVEDGGHVDVLDAQDSRGGAWCTHQKVLPKVDLDDGTLVYR